MGRVAHLVRKEFLQLRRDRRMLPIVLIAPVLQLLVLGYAANLDVREIPTAICDLDRSVQSRELGADFLESGYFKLQARLDRLEDTDRYLLRGDAEMILVIPRGFGRSVARGEPASLQLLADGTESSSATIGLSYASLIVSRYAAGLALERIRWSPASGPGKGAVVPVPRLWYNPELKSRDFLVPGILALLLMVMTTLLTSLAIVKEKEAGTLEQLIVTPLRAREMILGKLLPFVVIGFIDVLLVVLVATLLFRIPVKGSLLLLFAFSGLFLLTTLGLGLLVSTLSRNQQQAMMTTLFFLMLPMTLLSGFVFPIENMPRPIQLLTYILPLRYYFVIVRGLFLKGVGLAELWDEAAMLLGFGLLILGASSLRFRKPLE